MAKEQINFELVSPEEKLVAEPVSMAVIPGVEGEMGVAAGHAPFIVALKPGVVELFREGNAEPQRIFIAGGFADVTAKSCIVLAEEATDVTRLNEAEIEQNLRNLQEDLGMAQDAFEKARVEGKISVARARLQAVTGHIAA